MLFEVWKRFPKLVVGICTKPSDSMATIVITAVPYNKNNDNFIDNELFEEIPTLLTR